MNIAGTDFASSACIRSAEDKVIESVQREALAAALALGFECTSRQKLLPALKRELAFWKEEYCWELDGPVADFADYPKAWSRVACIEVIRMLLEEILGIIDGAGLDSGLESVMRVYRCYAPGSIQQCAHQNPLTYDTLRDSAR